MNKSTIISLILVGFIIILSIYLLRLEEAEETIDEPYYSGKSSEWLETEREKVIINVTEASEAQSDYDLGYQRFIDLDGSLNSIYLTGAHRGELFSISYVDDNEKTLMRVYPEMNPKDGIMEGFILVKREEGELVAYLFIDDDWKIRARNNINIIYGEDIGDKDSFVSRKFDFSDNNDGIYIDKIEGDIEWITEQNPIIGRLFLGDITLEDIKKSDYSKTFILLT